MSTEFFPDGTGISWESERTGAECTIYHGEGGGSQLEVVVTDSEGRPTEEYLRNTYTDRRGGRVSPILVVATYGDGEVGLCGPSGEEPNVYRDIDEGPARRVCDAALDEPDHHAARRFLTETIPRLEDELAGVHNRGLLSTHELKVGVPERDDWHGAADRASTALPDDSMALLEGLDYEIERLDDQSHVLRHAENGRKSAVAIFLQGAETFEHEQDRFVGDSPIAYALRRAEEEGLEYVIGSSGGQLRLYTTNPEAGFGSRGQTDTYVEVNTRLLDDERAAYLWLLFSADALQDDGSLHQIVEDSKEYATGLGERLRERIYEDVVPQLAEALAVARDLEDPDKEDLDETYRMTLVLLYRLLFVAYAEDERFLPRHRNPRYDRYSVKGKARDIHGGREFAENETSLWDEVMALTRAIHDGSTAMGLPAYEGRLLSEDPEWTEAGAALATVELSDADFGPALESLFVDEPPDGWRGPVDFRNVGVREFGVIYEGLLESELSVAERDLTTEIEDGDEQYVPADEDDEVVVEANDVYLHGQSGERKSTGTYYTKTRFVEHLLDHSLEPTLEEHLERVDRVREEDGEAAAADAFFDFRTADIAMGSGHFLVGAVDRIEKAFRNYLQDDTIPGVEEELDNLKDEALAAFEDEAYTPDIEWSQLLRRQIARRCIYGVDVNPLATELARLSLWVHTFVPGLALTFLDYNLTTGDSLAGIGTLDELTDVLDVDRGPLSTSDDSSVMDEIRDDIEELGDFADTSAERVTAARETRTELDERLEPVRVRFDVLSAARIDDDIDTTAASDTSIDDPKELSSYENAREVVESTRPLHFPAAFPEVFTDDSGFDVIVGNPPWEKTKIERHEFWARHYPGLRGMTRRERDAKIADLTEERPDLVAEFEAERLREEKRSRVLVEGPYPGITSGDPDMYQAFSWRFWHLTRDEGRIGVVLPREAFAQKGSTAFRERVLDDGEIVDTTFLLNNGGWAFDHIHQQMTLALATLRKHPPRDRERAVSIRGPFDNEETFESTAEMDPYTFSVEAVKSWTDVASLPLLPSDVRSLDVFSTLQSHPRIDADRENEWKIVPYRTGITSSHCRDDRTDTRWPVYKGESFDIWNPDTGTYYGWGESDELTNYLEEKRSRSRKWPDDDRPLPCRRPVIAFRRVTNRTNTRTVVVSLVPPNVFVRDADPFLLWERGSERDEAYLTGVLSSLPLDWYARRFVEKHLDYYIFNGLPIPRPGAGSRLRERTIALAGRLAAVDERYAEWAETVGVEYGPLDEETKREHICELDAVVAHLYGLTREHVAVIFETFHENWDPEERLERVLDHYERWADRLEPDRERAAEDAPSVTDDD